MPLPLELGSIHDPSVRRAFEQLSMQFPITVTGGGGGGAPSGPAGGDLSGTYPNPSIATGVIVDGDISGTAAIARSKLDFGSGLVNADISATAAIAKSKLAALSIVNADVDAAAAIAESKLNLATDAAAGTGSRRTLGTGATQAAAGNDARFTDARAPTGAAGGDLSGTYPNPQIGTGVIVNADVNAAAAIDESKLNLATDAAAGTGSRRTLGTTSTSAAAGNRGLPTGGTSGQALTKNSATDYDVGWTTISAAASGFTDQHVYTGTADFTAAAAGTYMLPMAGGTTAFTSGAAGTGKAAFYIDTARYAVTGKTSKLGMRLLGLTNAVASTRTFTLNLYPVANTTGASGVSTGITLGTAVASFSAVLTTPAAASIVSAAATDVAIPASGAYAIAITISGGAMAAGSAISLIGQLFARYV